MGLQDRVEFWRARKTGDAARQLAVKAEQDLPLPMNIRDRLEPRRYDSLSRRQEPEEVRDMLTAFGVEDRLTEIQSKYWGCGTIFDWPGGYKLSMDCPKVTGYTTETTIIPATLPKTYSHYRSDMPEKGWGYGGLQISGHSPGIPEREITTRKPVTSIVHHSIFALVKELQKPKGSSQSQNELALFVAIGINPDLFLERPREGAYYRCYQFDLTETQEAIRKLGSGKFVPPFPHHTGRRVCSDYVTKPFAPWDIFSKSSSPEELDDFFAEYIVDADLDQKSIKQAVLESYRP